MVSLKSASTGVTGAKPVITSSSVAFSNEASDGVTGASDENSNGAVKSSKVATIGVLGANEIIEGEVVFEFTEAPSLLAKRKFTERVNTVAMMIVEVFMLCFFDVDEAKLYRNVGMG